MRFKSWEIREKAPASFLGEIKEISPFLAQLLYNRGLKTKEEVFAFLNPDYKKDLFSPFVLQDIKKATSRILKAIEGGEKILVWGDYDVDGVSSTAVLLETLKFLGAKNLDFYIPHKEKEGYGLSEEVLEQKIKEGVNLIITCDCGISANKEIKKAQEKGVDVIVSDHHEPPSALPNALAIINPKAENQNRKISFRELAGVGVAFKLAQALVEEKLGKENLEGEIFLKWLLDLVALGTLADVVPLVGENRVLAKYGLLVLRKTKRRGLKLLCQIAGCEIEKLGSSDVTFRIVPRLNAASRLAHGEIALNLLLEEDPQKAAFLAFQLDELNKKRQKIEEKILKEIREKIQIKEGQKILIVEGEGWPSGILGIIAGRLKDEYGMPVLVFNKENGVHTGSARSIEGFNIHEALNNFGDILIKFGGHEKAAGLSLPEDLFEVFYENLHSFAQKKLSSVDLLSKVLIDMEISFQDLTPFVIREIKRLEPFGNENPRPIFLTKNVLIKDKRVFGSRKQHLRLALKDKNYIKEGVAFGFGILNNISVGDIVDVVWSCEDGYFDDDFEIKILDIRKK